MTISRTIRSQFEERMKLGFIILTQTPKKMSKEWKHAASQSKKICGESDPVHFLG
jgi:hypothetical protein